MFSKRQPLPYQLKIHLPILFPRESRSPKGQRSYFYKKERKENVNEHFQRDNHYPTNLRFTYWFHFQENPGISKSKKSVPTKKKEKRTLMNVLKETTTIPLIQDSLTDHFQEDPRVQVRELFLQKRKKNECLLHSFLKRNPPHLKPTFSIFNSRKDSLFNFSKKSIHIKKKKKIKTKN